ncbi:metallophosphoesterase [Pseudovibrio sp. SCP19]|uniref:metallophosphoesterase n=1 Tax=Pseudovibrio sp. SCP19 TaxID=3141374 RepID=UPI00333AD62A
MLSLLRKHRASRSHDINQSARVFELPDNTRAYVVGDIHGSFELLKGAIRMIDEDAAEYSGDCYEIFLGDYIDRGKQSAEVLHYLAFHSSHTRKRICLKGNHEEVLLDFLKNPSLISMWVSFGGLETLSSFGVSLNGTDPHLLSNELRCDLQNVMGARLIEFLSRLPTSFELGDYYFVHAGVNPKKELSAQTTAEQLWIRDAFLTSARCYQKKIVHGHTPVSVPEILENRINIDTGAYFTGELSVLKLEGSQASILHG